MSHQRLNGSFSKARFWKKLVIVLAGPIINIIFGIFIYFIVVAVNFGLQVAANATLDFTFAFFDSIRIMLTGGASINDLSGPVGIWNIVSQTSGLSDFIYLLAIISLSLGLTNLLPIPPLDGGKLLIYIIEKVKRTPLKEENSLRIQMLGFLFIIVLSAVVMYNDIVKIF